MGYKIKRQQMTQWPEHKSVWSTDQRRARRSNNTRNIWFHVSLDLSYLFCKLDSSVESLNGFLIDLVLQELPKILEVGSGQL